MQRAKVRRTQATKAAPSRVADLHDAAQFEKLRRKYADRLIVLHTYTTWHAACKELKTFLNHLSTKAQYSHVVFLEADFEKDALNPVVDFVDAASIPSISFHHRGKLLEEVKSATPSSAYQALLRHDKAIGPLSNGHASAKQQSSGGRWRRVAKIAAAGLSVAAAGLLGYKLYNSRDSESKILQKIERINQQIKAARKGMAAGSKRKQRRRRGAPAATNVSTSELQDLYNERQGLEGRLNAIRMGRTHSASGRSADPQVQAYSPLDDSSSDSDEDED